MTKSRRSFTFAAQAEAAAVRMHVKCSASTSCMMEGERRETFKDGEEVINHIPTPYTTHRAYYCVSVINDPLPVFAPSHRCTVVVILQHIL